MKNASLAVQNLLAGSQYRIADLYQFTLVSGTSFGPAIYVTGFDAPLAFAGNTFLTGWTIKRGTYKQERGVKTQQLELTITPQPDAPSPVLIGGQSLMTAVRLALFDSAQVTWWKAFVDVTQVQPALVDAVDFFEGSVDTATAGRAQAVITATSQTIQLNIQMPRNLIQQSCVHTLYDGGCLAVQANFTNPNGVVATNVNTTTNNDITTNLGGSNTFTGTLHATTSITGITGITGTSGLVGGALVTGANIPPGTTLLSASGTTATMSQAATGSATETVTFSYPDDVYSLGIITFTSGLNNGVSRTVRRYLNAGGEVQFVNSPPSVMAPGDTFTIVAGCDRTMPTCTSRFANLAHFRGFPFVPQPETIYAGGISSGPASGVPLGRQGQVPGGSTTSGSRHSSGGFGT